jgi:hypothetical protein
MITIKLGIIYIRVKLIAEFGDAHRRNFGGVAVNLIGMEAEVVNFFIVVFLEFGNILL